MLKISKKSKIIDLLTIIRRKLKYTINDLILYKLKFDKRIKIYEFDKVEKENFN